MKTIVITGSTDGIGKLTAEKLAADGHRVYLHGRSEEKLAATVTQIKAGNDNRNIKGFLADFTNLAAVRNFAQKVAQEAQQIDVLINNAGVFKSREPLNKDGLDLRFVVNYLAPYMLTKELLPLLQKGDSARIINLSSAAQAPVSLAALAGKGQLEEGEAYAQSKLALTIWSFHLANILQGVTVIPVNPGSLLQTKMVKEAYGQSWSSADKGADILYDLAVSPEYQGVTGKYFDNDRGGFAAAHPQATDSDFCKELLAATERLLRENR